MRGVIHLPPLGWAGEPTFWSACGRNIGPAVGMAELDNVPEITPPGFRPMVWCSACFPDKYEVLA